MESPYKKKIYYLTLWVFIFFFIIYSRVIYLQIIQNEAFFNQGIKNFLRTEKVACLRGNILDTHGNLLATNRPITTIYWQGKGNKNLTSTQLEILETLQHILNPLDLTKISQAERMGTQSLIAEDISFAQLSKIVELFSNNPQIIIISQFKRFYPYQKIASHILGHLNSLNNFETTGKMGLEKIFHDSLQGQPGILLKTINSIGKKIDTTEIKSALAGQNIQTTLDLSLQHIAESLFPTEFDGTFILMDPENGAIRALVSKPDFDPSSFLDPMHHDEWKHLQQGQSFLNRAFNVCYPPASIFKLVTITAALEHGLIKPEDNPINCVGYFYFKGRKHHCDRRCGHGQLSIQDALAKSCNILFYHIATKLPIDHLADYAFRFGLGQKTNIIFPEKDGLVPTTAWKKNEKGERWWPGETLSCSIGQSYLLVTPIQIARMIASIFQGYLVTPRILEDEPIGIKPLNIQLTTRKFLKKSMKMAVQIGTGMTVNRIEDIHVYAKTGTAQVAKLLTNKNNKNILPHSWFVAYFYYKDNKPLTMVILLEHSGNSRPAKLFAKKFLMNYRSYMKNKEK